MRRRVPGEEQSVKMIAMAVTLGRCVVVLGAAGLLAACGAEQNPALAQRIAQTHLRHPATTSLLYVSNQRPAEVDVYSYPKGKPIAKLGPFDTPAGECVDSKGDVFITDSGAAEVVEYAHGGASPIASLSTDIYSPVRCSIDPSTGNLAVANHDSSSGRGSILIYAHALGTPAAYYTPSIFDYEACGYDGSGNLFVDGKSATGNFVLAELSKGGQQLNVIPFAKNIAHPADIQGEGSYLAIGAADITKAESDVYHVIVTNKSAKVVQTTHIGTQTSGFFIDAQHLVAAAGAESILFFSYPKGGAPTKFVPGTKDAAGVVVSASP